MKFSTIAAFFALTGLTALTTFTAVAAPELPRQTLTFLGDSLTAGYGLSAAEAYPALIQAELQSKGFAIDVVNAGVSGDTTGAALSRLQWILRRKPTWVAIALGGNDMLRGLAVEKTESNLRQIIRTIRADGSRPILLGMRAATNLGPRYVKAFDAIFPKLAREEKIPYLAFYIEPVAGKRALNQADGIHPTAEGQRLLAQSILKFLTQTILSQKQAL